MVSKKANGGMTGSRVEYLKIESQALRGNRLGDPHNRELAVYVPAGYDESTGRYPSLYQLPSHGRTSHYYLGWNQWDETMPQRLDRLIAAGLMPPVLVIFPDFWTRLGGSQFINSPIGDYTTYFTDEIIPTVDQHYRTLPSSAHRGVFGHSSGGYGAFISATQFPQLFGGFLCQAGDMYWEYTALSSLAKLHLQLQKYGGYEKFIADIPTIRPKGGDFWQLVHTMMYCMAYAPNSQSPYGFDSPIDLETGALIPEVWQRWLAHDPVRIVDNTTIQENLRQLRIIILEVGSYDEYVLQVGARILHHKLQAVSIDHYYDEFPDGHSNTSYRYDVSLPILAKALSE